MIYSAGINEFLESPWPLIDVRSQGEYVESHMIGADNVPVLNDEHRELVGKCYKQQGQDQAIRLGYELVNPIRQTLVEQAQQHGPDKRVKLYCARGGLRSQKMAEFLAGSGFEVLVLKGGYKSYRNKVLERIARFRDIKLLGGHTGSGKTEVLHALAKLGA